MSNGRMSNGCMSNGCMSNAEPNNPQPLSESQPLKYGLLPELTKRQVTFHAAAISASSLFSHHMAGVAD